jgi:hypothetical protein
LASTLVQETSHSSYKSNVYELSTIYTFFIECKPKKYHSFNHLQQLPNIPTWKRFSKFLGTHNFFKNTHIPFVSILFELKKRLIILRQTFPHIYQVQGYVQLKMHGNVINVRSNLNIIQSFLPRLFDNETTFGLIIKRKLEYNSFYISGNIQPNQVLYALLFFGKVLCLWMLTYQYDHYG